MSKLQNNSPACRNTGVLILGGGPAGLKAARTLHSLGVDVLVLEKESMPGGKLLQWNSLFPFGEEPAAILNSLLGGMEKKLCTGVDIRSVKCNGDSVLLTDASGSLYTGRVLLVTTGFIPFNAEIKEEYGYGIYDNVLTSTDLEQRFAEGKVLTSGGRVPERVGMVHCVGSRDIKVGNEYCSSVCCITGIKQSVHLKKFYPDIRITHLYMDLRLGGRFYEQCYKEAQMEHRIQFVRGRLSETNPNPDGSLAIRYEDTLAGKPAKLTVDLLVLLVGMVPSSVPWLNGHILRGSDGFFGEGRILEAEGRPEGPAIYQAGACTGPKNLGQSMQEATDIALKIYLDFFASTAVNPNN